MEANKFIKNNTLQNFVPLNSIDAENVARLGQDLQIETLCQGQTLFKVGDRDGTTVYLLSGTVALTDLGGHSKLIEAGALDSFYPLDHCQPRKSNAIAVTDVSLVRLDRYKLDTVLSWDQTLGYTVMEFAQGNENEFDGQADWKLNLLKLPLFRYLPPENIINIFNKLKTVFVKEGELIVRQGEEGDSWYYLRRGAAEVLQTGFSGNFRVAKLGTGDCFGEEALLGGSPRNACVRMLSKGILMKLNKDDFVQLLMQQLVEEFSWGQLNQWHQPLYWIDVRTEDEYNHQRLAGAFNLPLKILRLKAQLLDRNKAYIVYCDSGRRSGVAGYLLRQLGFQVVVLAGGLRHLPAEIKLEQLEPLG